MLPIGFGGSVFVFILLCCALLCVLSNFAIILKRKRERADFFALVSYGCLVTAYVL